MFKTRFFRIFTNVLFLVSVVFLTYAFLGVMFFGCVPPTGWADLPQQDQQRFMRCEQDLFRASCYTQGEKFANPDCVQRFIREYTMLNDSARATWLEMHGCPPYLANSK